WIDEGYLICQGDTGQWMLEYLDIANQASERIYNAILNSISDEKHVKAVLDPYNPKGSTAHVGFSTTKDLWTTAADKCHINYVALDSDWEAEFARVAEQHARVIAFVKNQGLGLDVPYKDGSNARTYIPDFIVAIDDGHGAEDPLYLVVEVKGYRAENVKLKSETVRTQWVPGVNALGGFGRWAFDEFDSVYEIDKEFNALINRAVEMNRNEALQAVGAA
ncbi:MAG: restriction endonuclease, partial [Myxococcota bacterium]